MVGTRNGEQHRYDTEIRAGDKVGFAKKSIGNISLRFRDSVAESTHAGVATVAVRRAWPDAVRQECPSEIIQVVFLTPSVSCRHCSVTPFVPARRNEGRGKVQRPDLCWRDLELPACLPWLCYFLAWSA